MRKIITALILLSAATLCRAQDVSFIVNKDSKVTSLSADDAKSILLGNKQKFDDGSLLKLAILTDGPIQDKVIRDYTQRSSDQFEKYWKKQVFSGKGIMPEQCKSDTEMIDFVSKTPGAIGYVAKASVTPAVIAIDVK